MLELGGGLVPDMERGQLLDGVEGEEAEGGEEHRPVERAAEVRDALGNEVEVGSADTNAGAGRDDEPDVADRAQREHAADSGRRIALAETRTATSCSRY